LLRAPEPRAAGAHDTTTQKVNRDRSLAMPLTLPQVAKMFSVTENTVMRWIRQESLPARSLGLQYRFDQAELVEWAALHQRRVLVPLDPPGSGESRSQESLAEALQRGGVARQFSGCDRYEVFREAIRGLPASALLDRDELLDRLMLRERSGGVAIGGGIVIPHPRSPVVLPGIVSLLRACYLDYPLDFPTPDGKPVETLFLLVCPTVAEYLQLLARLISILQSAEFRQLLTSRPTLSVLVLAVQAEEQAWLENRALTAGAPLAQRCPPNPT